MLWVSIWRPHSLATAVAKTIGRGKYQVPVRKESSHTMVGRHDSVSVWSDHIGSTIETSLVLPIPHICDFFRITTFWNEENTNRVHWCTCDFTRRIIRIICNIIYIFIYLIRGYIMPHHTTSQNSDAESHTWWFRSLKHMQVIGRHHPNKMEHLQIFQKPQLSHFISFMIFHDYLSIYLSMYKQP